ncbi:MAG: hypothetical protein ABR954_02820 [Dehalococcoidales bacterium]
MHKSKNNKIYQRYGYRHSKYQAKIDQAGVTHRVQQESQETESPEIKGALYC